MWRRRPIVVNTNFFGTSEQMDELLRNQRRIIAALTALKITTRVGDTQIMADLSAIESEVSEQTEVVASAITLLNDLAQALRDAAGDPEAIAALAADIDANTAALAAAVAANTPEAPVEEPVEEPVEDPAPVDPAV